MALSTGSHTQVVAASLRLKAWRAFFGRSPLAWWRDEWETVRQRVQEPPLPQTFLRHADPLDLTRIAGLLALMAVVPISDIFLLWPALDLGVSHLFYNEGAGFAVASLPFAAGLRAYGMLVFELMIGLALIGLATPLLLRGRLSPIPPRWSLGFLVSIALGPGLLVNGILKEWSGRVRPRDILEFGGSGSFTPVWDFSGSCSSNCSFVSGEGSMAAMLLMIVLLVPAAYRCVTLAVMLPFALLVAGARIAFGGHFLSDTLLSWCLTLMVVALVEEVLSIRRLGLTNAAIAERLGRAGVAVGDFVRRLTGQGGSSR